MVPLRDLPIRRKLALTTLASTAAALLLAGGGFLAWDLVQYRALVGRELQSQAEMVARNSAAPLAFGDPRLGTEVLRTLQVRPRIILACLHDRQGAVVATYEREPGPACRTPTDESSSGWRGLSVVVPVIVNGERTGTVYLRRDFEDLYTRVRVGLAAVLAVLLVATGAAVFTGSRMQRLIASPLLDLADTAQRISSTHDYSLRARSTSGDEIGFVVNAFNEMLDRVAEALERERRANRLKDEFLATLSHELRTPLNAVLGWTHMLRSGRLGPAQQAKALDTIERNARAQARLVEDLLDMSTIVGGKPRLRLQRVDLAEIIESSVEVIRPAAAGKRLQLHVEITVRPAATAADASRIQQVVWNLLSNAVKFTPPGGQVWIRLDRDDHGFLVTVQDSGPGIEAAFLPFVFNPFRQADATATREHGGLGLGLAIAKQMVELHGGMISVRNADGGGAIFHVHLPAIVAEPGAEVPADTGAASSSAPVMAETILRGIRVLVVEDDADSRTLLETALTQCGVRVVATATVADAIASMTQSPPDILISDVGMPGEDGYSLIRRVRTDPALNRCGLPAIAVTAYASTGDALSARTAGFDAHVAKPIDMPDLVRLIATLVRPASEPESPAAGHVDRPEKAVTDTTA